MSYLVVLIVDDPDNCSRILDAWEELGANGITILESTGIGRVRRAGMSDDIPLMPSLRSLFEGQEERHRTLFSVVPSQEMVDRMVATSQEVIGNLDEPGTGFLFVLPVLQAFGLGKRVDS